VCCSPVTDSKSTACQGEQPVSHRKENAGRRAANLCALNIKPEEEPTRGGQENAALIEGVLEGVLEERPKTGQQNETTYFELSPSELFKLATEDLMERMGVSRDKARRP
jgi:hypothetical protein